QQKIEQFFAVKKYPYFYWRIVRIIVLQIVFLATMDVSYPAFQMEDSIGFVKISTNLKQVVYTTCFKFFDTVLF
ncbi:MAG: hypothetical protein Q3993_06065, partial [Filifactor alocis]|nr:hypothetical protein [Filifactor alocis]